MSSEIFAGQAKRDLAQAELRIQTRTLLSQSLTYEGRLTPRVLPLGLDVQVPGLQFHPARIRSHRDGQRVVQRARFSSSTLLVDSEVVIQDLASETGPRRGVLKVLQLLPAQFGLLCGVQPDHGEGHTALRHYPGGFRVNVDVELGHPRRRVPRHVHGTAHEDQASDSLGERRVEYQGRRDVGQRSNGNYGQLS